MTQLAGTFHTMSWDEEQYDAAPGHPKFTHARVTHELTAPSKAKRRSVICWRIARIMRRRFVGFAMVTGTVKERAAVS